MSTEQKITNYLKLPNRDLETLKTHFPHYFDKNGKFDFEKFKNYLTEKEVAFSTESYGLEWLGKSYSRLLASDPATTLLKANEEWNSRTENVNSENLLIKGDNLEVLKHLVHAYYEKIKMIYIDPPYNTGSDGFIYQDDRKYTVKELQELIDIDEEKAKRILDFTQSKSNSHSAWLTFMYPRLYIAKQLLRDDGVIFVSIDDNEVAQLRLLMDEIFGEENFVGQFLWNKTATPPSLSNDIRKKYEYILCFQKSNYRNYGFSIGQIEGGDMPLLNETNSDRTLSIKKDAIIFKINGKFNKGIYDRVELLEDIEIENGKSNKDLKLKGRFKWTQETLDEEIKKGTVFFVKTEKFAIRYQRNDVRIKTPSNIINKAECGVGTNEDANKELSKLFYNNAIFNFPKPTSLIVYLINMLWDKNLIILDFFAGSGTTGDAVMQLNAEDGGNRKYILVQLAEPIDPKKNKTAYDFVKDELKAEPTIFEITKERLIRAAKKIKSETIDKKIAEKEKEIKELETELDLDDKVEKIEKLKKEIESLKNQDLGFKIFETMPIWEDYDFEVEQFNPQQTLFDIEKLTDDDLKALLTTWKTYDGIALTQDLESVDLNGYTADYGNGKLYLMHKGFTTNNLKALLEKIDTDKHFEPKSIIAFGYHFESARLRELAENIKHYTNKKHIDLDFIIRY